MGNIRVPECELPVTEGEPSPIPQLPTTLLRQILSYLQRINYGLNKVISYLERIEPQKTYIWIDKTVSETLNSTSDVVTIVYTVPAAYELIDVEIQAYIDMGAVDVTNYLEMTMEVVVDGVTAGSGLTAGSLEKDLELSPLITKGMGTIAKLHRIFDEGKTIGVFIHDLASLPAAIQPAPGNEMELGFRIKGKLRLA